MYFLLCFCLFTFFICFFFLSVQNKDSRSLNEKLVNLENSYSTESEKMRGELGRLRGAEEDAKNKTNQVSSLLEELEKLKKELRVTQQEKKTIEDWAQTYRDEMETVRHHVCSRLFTSVHVGLLSTLTYLEINLT